MLVGSQEPGRGLSGAVLLVGLVACSWTPKNHVADGLKGAAPYAHVINGRSGRCLDVNGGATTGGARIIQYGCHTDLNMEWAMIAAAGDDTYQIQNRKSRKCIQPEGGSTDDYVGLIQANCTDAAYQRWRFEAEGELYRIVNAASGLCLSVFEESAEDYAHAIQTDRCNDLSARWR
jgi:hypothetical protein